VSSLRPAKLIARKQHRCPLRKQQDGGKVLDLAQSQGIDLLVLCRTLYSMVGAEGVIRSIPVTFAVRKVVLLIVGNEIVEREAIMAGHEIDALIGRTCEMLIEIGAAGNSGGNRADHPCVAADESPEVVAIAAVPFSPSFPRKASDLIKPG